MAYGRYPPQGLGSLASTASVAGRAIYYRSTNQTISTGVTTIVDFATQTTDALTKGSVTTGASWRYTASEDVDLIVSAGVLWATATWAYVNSAPQLQIFVDGVSYALAKELPGQNSGAAAPFMGRSVPIRLAASSYFDVRVLQSDGTNRDVLATASSAVHILELSS